MKDDSVLLLHIMECIRRIEQNAAGREQFMASHSVQDAVLRNLQTLSESTQRLSDGLKAKYPDVEWRRVGRFATCWSMTTSVSTWKGFGQSFKVTSPN